MAHRGPNPAVRGGAVETLVDLLVEENERERQLRMCVFSVYDERAEHAAQDFQSADFQFIRIPRIVGFFDKVIHRIAKDVLKKTNSVSYRYILQRLYFIQSVGKRLAGMSLDWVVLENHATLLRVLKVKDNRAKYRDKVIYHMHNEVHGVYGCSEELAECRRIFGVSDYVNRIIVKSNPHSIKPDQLRVFRNKVDSAAFEKASSDGSRERIRKKLGISQGEKMILFTGRICPDKGVLELVESFSQANIANARLVIVGAYFFGSELKTAYEEKLRDEASRLGDRILFTGYVDHALMPAYYMASDVVVVPSVWDDPAPLAIVEAITAGKRIVTTNSGGIPEYARYGYATIVERGSIVSGLVSALREAVEDCDKRGVIPEGWSQRGYYEDFLALLEEAAR